MNSSGICTICAVGFLWDKFTSGDVTNPMQVFSIDLAVNSIRTMIQQTRDKKAAAAGRHTA